MSEAVYLNVETQSGDKQIISISHINTRLLGLESSFVAQQLYSRNTQLFINLNNSTEITDINFYRHSLIKSKPRTNRLSTKILDSYDSIEENILTLNFENDFARPKERYKFPSGKKADVDLANVSVSNTNKKNILNLDNLSKDDLKNAEKVCRGEELLLFQSEGIRTFMFQDNFVNNESVKEVSYSLKVSVKTIFDQYINNVIDKLQKSIVFLENYYSFIIRSKQYNYENGEFKTKFIKETMQSVGIEYPFTTLSDNTNKSLLNKSDFGIAAKNYYNAVLLLRPDVPVSVYDNILVSLLPLKTSSPESIGNLLTNFKSIKTSLDSIYLQKKSNTNKRQKSAVSLGSFTESSTIAYAKGKFDINHDDLGYNVFSNFNSNQKFSKTRMKQRINSEAKKYYPVLNNPKKMPGLLNNERQKFSNLTNAPAFLTPIGIRNGNKTIGLERGVFTINPEEISDFRIKKSIKSAKEKTDLLKTSTQQNKISSTAAAAFNITIGEPAKSAIISSREGKESPTIDSREFLGDNSFFITSGLEETTKELKKSFKKFNKRNGKVLKKIIPKMFLRQKNTLTSINDITLSNKDSKMSKGITESLININDIPPQIKSMGLATPIADDKSDPLKNSKLGPILKETQMNTFVIKYLQGFSIRPDGFYNVHDPVYSLLNNQVLNSNLPVLIKAEDYEIPELGILKDKQASTIYNSLIYVRGNN